jgi:hypothetical protein
MCAVVDTRRQHTHFGETSKLQHRRLGSFVANSGLAARIAQSALNIRYRATNRLLAFGISAFAQQLKTFVVRIWQRISQTENFANAITQGRAAASIQMPSPHRPSNLICDDLDGATEAHARDS